MENVTIAAVNRKHGLLSEILKALIIRVQD